MQQKAAEEPGIKAIQWPGHDANRCCVQCANIYWIQHSPHIFWSFLDNWTHDGSGTRTLFCLRIRCPIACVHKQVTTIYHNQACQLKQTINCIQLWPQYVVWGTNYSAMDSPGGTTFEAGLSTAWQYDFLHAIRISLVFRQLPSTWERGYIRMW